jgi:threonine/homoserine/homoserine lactone efflux protein
MLTDKANVFENDVQKMEKFDLRKIYKQGVLTNVLNPKVALFYLAFLPQFINPEFAKGSFPFLLLGGTFMTTLTIWSLFLVYVSSFLTKALRNNDQISRALQKISGAVFIGLGIKLLTIKK